MGFQTPTGTTGHLAQGGMLYGTPPSFFQTPTGTTGHLATEWVVAAGAFAGFQTPTGTTGHLALVAFLGDLATKLAFKPQRVPQAI